MYFQSPGNTAIDGAWSPWSSWSTCGADCLQHSSRLCNSPAPQFGGRDCQGNDFVSRNCSGGMCTGKKCLIFFNYSILMHICVL